MKVALTGNIASGKTSLSRVWASEGVPLVRADDLARKAVEPGTGGLAALVESFGQVVLNPDGTLNRGVLREMVFHDPERRKTLEGILHPLILALREDWIREREEEGAGLVVAEIPLLFETGLEKDFDFVVFVDAPQEERLRRLVEDRGLEEDEARRMMGAQLPARTKRERADFVIDNGGNREDLEIRARALLDLLRARSAGRKAP